MDDELSKSFDCDAMELEKEGTINMDVSATNDVANDEAMKTPPQSSRSYFSSDIIDTPVTSRISADRMPGFHMMKPVGTGNAKSAAKATKSDAVCQTVYSFPMDFDLGIFFNNPSFLQNVDEEDKVLLQRTDNASSEELRRRVFEKYDPIYNVVEESFNLREDSKSSVDSDGSDIQNISDLLQTGANVDDVPSDASFLIGEGEDEENGKLRRHSSWRDDLSESRSLSSRLRTSGSGDLFDPIDSVLTSEGHLDMAERLSLSELSLSPIADDGNMRRFSFERTDEFEETSDDCPGSLPNQKENTNTDDDKISIIRRMLESDD